MSEINNNMNNIDVTKLSRPEAKKEAAPSEPSPNVAPKEVGLQNMPSEALGRSQVKTNSMAAVTADAEYAANNPDEVTKAVHFCDEACKVLEKAGVEHPYEKAATFMGAFNKEFSAK